ncbi:GumC family protein [Mucisphaera sp.]|uniref:GumC family protein n=1 Tax=Mucisphaera sp. TaxID=2913024 RepID=UPI003D13A36A
MTQSQDQQTALFELWSIVWRYRWRFVLPCFAVMVAVLIISLTLPRKYRSEAIFETRTDMVLKEMTSRGASGAFQVPRNSVTEELTGEVAIDRLIREIEPELREMGVIQTSFDRQQLRLDLLRKVTVRWDLASAQVDRIRVSYTGPNPAVTRLVVNNLVEQYIAATRAQMDARLNESADFFRNELASSRQTIEEIENRMLRFEIENAVLLPDNPLNIQNQLIENRQELEELVAKREAIVARLSTLRDGIEQQPTTVQSLVMGANPARDELNAKRRELNRQLDTYLNVYKMREQHPDVQSISQQISTVEARIAEIEAEVVTAKNIIPNPKRTEMELSLARSEGELNALDDEISSIKASLETLGASSAGMFPVRSEYRKLQRELTEARGSLQFWETNLRRIELALTAENGNRGVQFAFVKRAGAAWRPVSPDLTQVLLACGLLGVIAGSLGVFFAHRMEATYYDGNALANDLGLPLIGSVSEVITHDQRRSRRLRRLILYPTNAVVMATVLVGVGALLYLDLERPHVFAVQDTEAIESNDAEAAPAALPEPRNQGE